MRKVQYERLRKKETHGANAISIEGILMGKVVVGEKTKPRYHGVEDQ